MTADAETPDAATPEVARPVPATPASVRPAAPRPGAVASGSDASGSDASGSDAGWGRVEDDGTVSVREGEEWRVVGQYPDGSPQEALAYFERKYADLASEVTLLEVRARRGGASAADLRSTAETLRGRVVDAAAVGDLAALRDRLDALTGTLAEATEAESAAAKEAVEEAVRERTTIVEAAEALAARDPQHVQWKQVSAEMSALFDRWQKHQSDGPRLPRSQSQQLWRRFRDARATVDKHRREFYASLDQTHKAARDAKTRLVERAEALAPRGEEAIGTYRDLLDEWKRAGRAGKKVDDALWARFKAAGDALYGARAEREAADAEASQEKIQAKRALLAEAAPIVDERDLARARSLLTGIQRRWDEVGRIHPRETERSLDDELRKIEQSVRTREDADWKRNNPETKARANDMTRQLTDAIDKLESELADAESRGDARAAAAAREALEARKAWLRAVGG
ncbi:DUF349 domain-containing protein [Microbacterium sp. 10M-3C3]|uniref:DUF349 domain-containing protein n=1 Tax=Microbacterium sp. 10M-3C3 TaxID=2483401 RepID=UPI003204E310